MIGSSSSDFHEGDIRSDESGFGFGECIRLGMRACKRGHDRLSCTRLNNYTIVYTKMAALTKFIARNNKTASKTA